MLVRSLGLPALMLTGLLSVVACGDKDDGGSDGDGGSEDGGTTDGGSGTDGGSSNDGGSGDGGSGDGGSGDGGSGDGGASVEGDCDNGEDDDGDSLIDCDDPDCDEDSACHEIICNDGLDDDGDGLTDCDDPDCLGNPICPELDCDNGVDDDGDRYADCLDADCLDDPACNDPELDCGNGLDDDEDGRTDCEDTDCGLDAACFEYGCDDDLDSDDDGLIDCADPDCFGEAACTELICDDGLDDDGDGGIDCLDVDCWYTTTCILAECADELIEYGAEGEVWSGSTADLDDTFDDVDVCGTYDARDVGLVWEAPKDGCFEVSTEGSGFDTVLRIYDSCRTSEESCADDYSDEETYSFTYLEVDEGELKVLVVDGATSSDYGDAVLSVNEYEYPYDVEIGEVTGEASAVGDIDGLEELRALPSCAWASSYDDLLLWTAPADGTYTFDLSESEFDTVLALYRVEDQCPEEIACNDDEDLKAEIYTSWLQVELEAGNTVLIWIAGYSGTELGDWQLDIARE